ncbi:cation transporter [Rhodopila sp.]|uniref:cation transporter n=1 Tax=Rhodopila sp. TaxID=2480087 RepID=UPI003D0AB722
MACSHDPVCSPATHPGPPNSPHWRRALWIALIINAGFFLTEIVAGAAAGSTSLQADALDFFGDAANYAISLGVAGMALEWRARAALAKGATLIAFALWILASTAWHATHPTLPRAEIMGMVGIAALIANGGVALMLYRFRTGDANMRSVWICSRNDAVGNAAVLLAAIGVFGTATGWPDVIVGAIMGGMGLWGGWQIVSQAGGELRSTPTGYPAPDADPDPAAAGCGPRPGKIVKRPWQRSAAVPALLPLAETAGAASYVSPRTSRRRHRPHPDGGNGG